MNPFEMVVLIVLIVAVAGVLKARYRVQRHVPGKGAADAPETIRLRDEVRALKERLAVIERITVEKESALEREIEQLRDQ